MIKVPNPLGPYIPDPTSTQVSTLPPPAPPGFLQARAVANVGSCSLCAAHMGWGCQSWWAGIPASFHSGIPSPATPPTQEHTNPLLIPF